MWVWLVVCRPYDTLATCPALTPPIALCQPRWAPDKLPRNSWNRARQVQSYYEWRLIAHLRCFNRCALLLGLQLKKPIISNMILTQLKQYNLIPCLYVQFLPNLSFCNFQGLGQIIMTICLRLYGNNIVSTLLTLVNIQRTIWWRLGMKPILPFALGGLSPRVGQCIREVTLFIDKWVVFFHWDDTYLNNTEGINHLVTEEEMKYSNHNSTVCSIACCW